MGKQYRVYRNPFVITLGKVVQALARLSGGKGSAFPGLVVDKIAPGFAPKILAAMPYGVVIISGTNGKTTTAKIVTELLESMGLRVLTNDTGSNFMRGVVAALLSKITLGGHLDADIAVLELDEAHAVSFVKRVSPRFSLLLNVMPDQLDRFGSVEYTAGLLQEVAQHTINTVVINREDSYLSQIDELPFARICRFGLSPQLHSDFLHKDDRVKDETRKIIEDEQFSVSVILSTVDGNKASFVLDGSVFSVELALKGIYNAFNAAAALALVREVLKQGEQQGGQQDDRQYSHQFDQQLVNALASIQSAFGRGESFIVGDREIEVLLVKNSKGFQLTLDSFDPLGFATMVAINDEYGDGRDVSWLFDVDFTALQKTGVAMISGKRAYDMALRLSYDEVPCQQIEADVLAALDHILSDETRTDQALRIFCTYSAMTKLHTRLKTLTREKKLYQSAGDR